jgi:hypothetical protein
MAKSARELHKCLPRYRRLCTGGQGFRVWPGVAPAQGFVDLEPLPSRAVGIKVRHRPEEADP